MAGAGLLNTILKTFLGSKTDRDLKELSPIVEKTNQVYKTLQTISGDELRAKTLEFKAKIETTDKEIDQMIYELYGLTVEEIKIVEGK